MSLLFAVGPIYIQLLGPVGFQGTGFENNFKVYFVRFSREEPWCELKLGVYVGVCSTGFPMGPCYGPFYSGGVCSMGPSFEYGI